MKSPPEHESEDLPSTAAEAIAGKGDSGADPDADCAARASRGDRAATELLVERHQAAVARLLWRFVRSPSDLDDLVQETFLRMVRGLPGWTPQQPFGHWLLRIATNTGRDYFRRQSVRRRWLVDPALAGNADNVGAPPETIDPGLDPAARAAANEAKAVLAHLSPDERTLLTLHHLEGWPLAQIAAQFGWTVTATKLRAWRARRQLRAILESRDQP